MPVLPDQSPTYLASTIESDIPDPDASYPGSSADDVSKKAKVTAWLAAHPGARTHGLLTGSQTR
jgi:hypothetical protein